MLAGVIEIGDEKRPLDLAEPRHDDAPVAHGAAEKGRAHRLARRPVQENARSRHARLTDAGPGKKLAPAAGGVRMGHVHGLRIEREGSRAQSPDGREGFRRIAVADFQEEVFPSLCGHVLGLLYRLRGGAVAHDALIGFAVAPPHDVGKNKTDGNEAAAAY